MLSSSDDELNRFVKHPLSEVNQAGVDDRGAYQLYQSVKKRFGSVAEWSELLELAVAELLHQQSVKKSILEKAKTYSLQ